MSHEDHREEIIIEHPHAFDPGEPSGSLIAILGFAIVVTLVITGLAVQFYFDRYKEDQVYQKVMVPESEALKSLRATEQAELTSYGYIDRAKGSVRVPIDRAMELYIKESAAGTVKHPIVPYAVKTPEQIAAAAAPPAGAAPPATEGATPNAKPAGH